MEAVLARAEWGTLGLVSPQGTPVLVPVNFVFHQGQVVFHGARAGEKFDLIQAAPQASFVVVDAYAPIPSYAFSPVDACPATQFFQSVLVKGPVALVEDPERKAEALEALMRKLQPEGGWETIRADSPRYQASLRGVAVFSLLCREMTMKVKLGRKLSPDARSKVEEILRGRGGVDDLRTVEAMRNQI
jgi:nitroimidazol reductase NimA-like FMN-containing flavoprotein (pyridoxamine 5'-phosphate oxidase superfamily)